MKLCSFESCDRKHYSLGFCSLHYKRDKKARFPLLVKEQTARDCRSPKGRFAQSRAVAAKRGLVWNLSLEDFMYYAALPCYYWPSHKKPETNSGLDRRDNTKGYEVGNVVPCCKDCNIGRGNRYTVEEWSIAINAIENRRLENGIKESK